jgi:gliding motility-associated-like protein
MTIHFLFHTLNIKKCSSGLLNGRMKFLLILFLFLPLVTKAQPGWTVNYADYQYTMTVSGVIVFDYVDASNPGNLVGAFHNDTCHGFASPVLDSTTNRYIIDMVIYSNINGIPMTFKVYDAGKNTTVDIETGMPFEINKIVGSSERPYYWSSPTLSSEAKFTSFNISGQKGETAITDSTVIMNFAADFLLGNCTATFEVPNRSQVKVGNVIQTSGESYNNFVDTVLYTVISADETDTIVYSVISIAEKSTELNTTNVITPNGDGINDYWVIHNSDVFSDYELKIYNSTGLEVFSTSNYQNNWNGKYKSNQLPAGAYHYVLKKSNSVFSGTISIIR